MCVLSSLYGSLGDDVPGRLKNWYLLGFSTTVQAAPFQKNGLSQKTGTFAVEARL